MEGWRTEREEENGEGERRKCGRKRKGEGVGKRVEENGQGRFIWETGSIFSG